MDEKTNGQYALDIINGMHERTERRLWQIIIALIVVIALITVLFVWYLNQYDFAGEKTEMSQDGEGINIIGTKNGAYIYGTENDNDNEVPNA